MVIGTHAARLDDPALSDFAQIARIRTGRQATLYRAWDIPTAQTVALKVLDVGDRSPRAIEAFDRESTVLAALGSHPNIVTLHRRLNLSDRRPVLVLELCDGSVADRLSRGQQFSPAQVVALGIRIAGALETAHQGGVLHRDVRPEHILLTESGEPALSDFGIATLRTGHLGASTLVEFATVHTAPELIEGGPITPATDVYGLASTLYELIAGEPAFRAYQSESTASVCLRILRDPVPPIATPAVPLDLSDVLLWAMSKDATARPPSAAWLATELSRIAARHDWPRTRLLVDARAEPVVTGSAH
ncbi:MAG: protein kinase/LuxR family transcriptional regulator [Pseudonocardiales bacterium]|nr:protein kinase/LuxR family transcriptional regulator [Pseudonocardiales bacterium]